MTTNDSASLLAQVHHAFMDPLLRLGRAPNTVEVAEQLGLGPKEVVAFSSSSLRFTGSFCIRTTTSPG
jgi:hypothetical protein